MIPLKGLYLKKCQNCKKLTPHRVYNLSIKRGSKLQCLCCANIQKKYENNKKLVPYAEQSIKLQEESKNENLKD